MCPRPFYGTITIRWLTALSQIFAWNSNTITRPPAKRTVALSFMNAVGNMASIWTPFTYIKEPYYRLALGIVLGLFVCCAIMATVLRTIMVRTNAKMERLENDDSVLTEKEIMELQKTAEIEGVDLATARQLQKGFRYII